MSDMTTARVLLAFTLAVGGLVRIPAAQSAQPNGIDIQTVASGMRLPMSIVFPSPTTALVLSYYAAVHLIDLATGRVRPLQGVPEGALGKPAGFFDLALHPQFETNRLVYLSMVVGEADRTTLGVVRGRLVGDTLVDATRVFTARAWNTTSDHYGGQMVFRDGFLFVTVGDREHGPLAQDLASHAGKVLRLLDDGRTAPGNPFSRTEGSLPEIWTIGHRNAQGMAVHPETGELWISEHGPRHGDELNRLEAGRDYGWPRVSFGWLYEGGAVGSGLTTDKPNTVPIWVWTPAIVPSGLMVYTGNEFPEWRGSFLIGSMNPPTSRHINRLVFDGARVVLEERLLTGEVGRVRFVEQGPDGALFVGNEEGQLLRLSRAKPRP